MAMVLRGRENWNTARIVARDERRVIGVGEVEPYMTTSYCFGWKPTPRVRVAIKTPAKRLFAGGLQVAETGLEPVTPGL